MPTVLRVGPYRFFFYAGDRDEPPHVHIERDDKLAKFWLDPFRLWDRPGLKGALEAFCLTNRGKRRGPPWWKCAGLQSES